MAWLDFIKKIQQTVDDDKKNIGDFLNSAKDKVREIGETKVQMPGWWDQVENFDEKIAEPVLRNTSDFLTDTLQSIPRGIVNTGLTIKQSMRDGDKDQANKTLDGLLGMSEDRRKELAAAVDDPEKSKSLSQEDWSAGFIAKKAKEQLGGLDDKRLKDRQAENNKAKETQETYTAGNPFTKFLIGGEKDEVAQSAQKTNQDANKYLRDNGASEGVAGALAPVAAGVNAILDVPTGIGNLVKGVGKSGIKQLAKEGGEDAVKSLLKDKIPKMTDEVADRIVPLIAKASDPKEVTKILETAGRNVINPVAAPLSALKGNISAGIDSIGTGASATKDFISSLAGGAKKNVDTAVDTVQDLNPLLKKADDVDPLDSTMKNPAPVDPNTVSEPLLARPNIPGTPAPNPLDQGKGIIDSAVDKAQDIISPKTPKPTGYGSATDELLGRIKYNKDIDKPAGGIKQQLKEQFVDKLSPINNLVQQIEKQTGTKLATEDNPYQLMRLYQGMPDRVQKRVQGLTDVLKQAPDINSVKAIGMARQIIDRGTDVLDDAGNVVKKGISSTISPERAREVIAEQRAKLGDQAFDKAASVVDSVNKYNQELLDDLKNEGIISEDSYKAIMDTGANYFSRFNVVEHIMKDDQNRALFASGGSYNTTKASLNKILKSATGHQEGSELLDPIESIVRSTDATMRAISKNQIWKSFDRLAEKAPDLVQRVRNPDDVLERINLATDSAEMRPLRQQLARIIKTQGRAVRELHSEINKLEKKGLATSLKEGGERITDAAFEVAGLGGKVPTSQTGKMGEVAGFMDTINPQKLGPQDTARFVKNLIENGSRSEIDRLKKMVGNRDAKLTRVLDSIGEVKSHFDDVAGKIKDNSAKIRELGDGEAPDGYALISGFGKGQQGKLAVPKEIADVFTGKNAAQQDYLTSFITGINGFVKQNFTSNNPAFALITNPIRDAKSFAYNAQDVKSNPFSIGKALVGGLAQRIKRGDVYDRWVEAGGRSGFYADERTGEKIAKDISRKVNGVQIRNAGDFVKEATRFVTTPLRVARDGLQGAASILEDAPRVAQFQASLKAGKSDAAAAFNARNVTVDFQQSGRIAQTVNAWIPFLNARFQGTLKSAEAIKRNPARAASVYATLTAAPIALAAMNNSQYPEVMKMIPDGDRDNNFVIVMGDHQDENGDYDQVIKIPKGDVDKILGNPLENFMRFLNDDDPDSLAEMVTNMIGSVLPVDVVKDDKFNASRAVGSLLPPLIKAPLENVTNRNLYYDSDVVPERLQDLPANEQIRQDDPNTAKVERSTSPIAEFLAPLLGGGSPIKSENTLRGFTGSLLTEAPQDQLGGKLNGVSSSKMNTEFYKTLNETSKNKNSASNHINQAIAAGDYAEAQRTAQAYNAYLKEQFGPFAQTYGSQMTQELADLYDQQKIVLTPRSIKQRQRNQLERQAAQ